MRSDVVCVIPALDCAASIGRIVMGLRAHTEHVVVVDDGSSDETAERARSAGAQVESLGRNYGKGVALRRGIELALELEPAAIALVDGDGQHDPEDLPVLLRAWDAGDGDLIVGSRLGDRDSIPSARYWNNFIGTRILSWMSGVELEDSQSGYRLISAPVLASLQLETDRYAIESEMLLKAANRGARIAHVPIRTIYQDESSHFRPFTDTVRIALAAIRVKLFDEP